MYEVGTYAKRVLESGVRNDELRNRQGEFGEE